MVYNEYHIVGGISAPSLRTTLVLKWGGGGSPNFTEFMVVKAYGMFSARIAHSFDTKTVELSAKRIMQGRWWFIQMKITLSKYFSYQIGEQSGATMPF